jgi:hypothetical protein
MFPWERRQMDAGDGKGLRTWEKWYWGVFVTALAFLLFSRLYDWQKPPPPVYARSLPALHAGVVGVVYECVVHTHKQIVRKSQGAECQPCAAFTCHWRRMNLAVCFVNPMHVKTMSYNVGIQLRTPACNFGVYVGRFWSTLAACDPSGPKHP